MLLPEIKHELKSESEELTNGGNSIGYTMLDFWKWRMSNVLNNTDRGAFAEFIVSKAINSDEYIRPDWREFDIATKNGLKIEVKSASYIQAWHQAKFSTIRFSIKKSRCPDSTTNTHSDIKRHSDLYVFCLLKHKNQKTINPLNMDQWEFYVVKTTVLNEKYQNRTSISLSDLQKITEPVSYNQLNSKILENSKLYK